MPGLGTTLFQLSVGETAVPTDKVYILPGFEMKPTHTETSMGIGSMLASHVFKPRYRDEPFLTPAPKPKKFEPIKPGPPPLKRSTSVPEEVSSESAKARREAYKRRRTASCKASFHYGSGESSISDIPLEEVDEEEDTGTTPAIRAAEARLAQGLIQPQDTVPAEPEKPRRGKKHRVAMKVLHSLGWILFCPVYTVVFCVRESPDPDDDDDLRDDNCIPCY